MPATSVEPSRALICLCCLTIADTSLKQWPIEFFGSFNSLLEFITEAFSINWVVALVLWLWLLMQQATSTWANTTWKKAQAMETCSWFLPPENYWRQYRRLVPKFPDWLFRRHRAGMSFFFGHSTIYVFLANHCSVLFCSLDRDETLFITEKSSGSIFKFDL